jgi:hypothetical protein
VGQGTGNVFSFGDKIRLYNFSRGYQATGNPGCFKIKTMSEEKNLTGEESLRLITEMIQKAKASVHERGTSAILWGTAIFIAGMVSFIQLRFKFTIGFDIWLLIFVALALQIVIIIRESKGRKFRAHEERAIDAIWTVFGISIAAVGFYVGMVPGVTEKFYAEHKGVSVENLKDFPKYIYSISSIYLIVYAIPTLATGIITKFKPMLIGGIACYILFVISCYTNTMWDMLLIGVAGLISWLIPGLILRQHYLKGKATGNV